jgi:methylated-DNA-[protein]-cysteine S-methyltransferase
MVRRFPHLAEKPLSPLAQQAADAITAFLAGDASDMSALPLAIDRLPEFDRAVLSLCRAIPFGDTCTYGDVARQLGDIRLSQRVGQALGRNPFAPIIPCHRVLAADGRIGGFSAGGGTATKLTLLNLEQARTGVTAGLFEALPFATKTGNSGISG